MGGVTGSCHAASPIHSHRTEKFINKLSLLLSNSASYIAASTPPMPSPRYTTKCCLASTSGMLRSLAAKAKAAWLCVSVWGSLVFALVAVELSPGLPLPPDTNRILFNGKFLLQPRAFNCCRNAFLLTFT